MEFQQGLEPSTDWCNRSGDGRQSRSDVPFGERRVRYSAKPMPDTTCREKVEASLIRQ
jgi:hypothetical protein